MTFVGLDLHKRYITACALGAGGAVLAEVRQMAVSLEALDGFLSALPAPVTVALESCLYWQRLHDQLDGQGHTFRVAAPRQVKAIWQARSKTDPIHARKLAALRRDSSPAHFHLSPAPSDHGRTQDPAHQGQCDGLSRRNQRS